MDIKTKRLRYIIPFMFSPQDNQSFADICRMTVSSPEWAEGNLRPDDVSNYHIDMYKYILDQFGNPEDDSNIGHIFRYTRCADLHHIGYHFIYRDDTPDYRNEISISDMGLYLFRTRIGLLWYEINFKEDINADQLIDFQNQFKELLRIIVGDMFSDCTDNKGLTHIGDIFVPVFESLPMNVTFFDSKGSSTDDNISALHMASKANLFSYIVLDPEGPDSSRQQQVIDAAYFLTSGYNRSFQHPHGIENDYFHPFDNVFWNIKREGCGGIVRYDDDIRSKFFISKRNMPRKVMGDYFVMYMLLLHQDYALIRYSAVIEKQIPAEHKEFSSHSRPYIDTMEDVLAMINTFLVKNIYTSVSYIDHQNEFYQYGEKKLHIRENVEALSTGMDSLADMQQIQQDHKESTANRIAEEDERLADLRLTIAAAVFSMLAIPSAFADLRALFNRGFLLNNLLFIFFFILIGISGFFMLRELIKSIRRRRESEAKFKQAQDRYRDEFEDVE